MRFLALSITAAALTASAHAKFITTNDKSVFDLLSQQGGYALAGENFGGYSGFYSSLSGGTGATAWQATALGGLYVGSGGQLSTNNADAALTMSFSSGDVYAIGGNFFLTDFNFGFLPGLVQVELADGSSYIANIQNANSFSGFVSLGSAISQITISPFGVQPNAYVTATNLCFGVVPAPGAVALMAVAGLVSRRRR
ncbi:MAG: hypothetical protein KGR22_00230 [Planctomycetes bacterium]|nr:hypothetical protein [Planctomycetota bacterium]